MSPELEDLVALYGIDNESAMEALRDTLPNRSGISPKYVHAGMTQAQLGLPLNGAKIHVLSPERDIDRFYLGAEADQNLQGLVAASAAFRTGPASTTARPSVKHQPVRLSPAAVPDDV